jgi:hypothetical protein
MIKRGLIIFWGLQFCQYSWRCSDDITEKNLIKGTTPLNDRIRFSHYFQFGTLCVFFRNGNSLCVLKQNLP